MKLTTIIWSLIIAFLFVQGCKKEEAIEISEMCNLTGESQQIYEELLSAYSDSCVSCFENILLDWNNRYTYDTEIPNDLKNVYEVFNECYTPWDLTRVSESEFGDQIYAGISFYIVQSKIQYNYNFGISGETDQTIAEFRPRIMNDTIKALYMNEIYVDAINCFLGVDNSSSGIGNIEEPTLETDEIGRRYRFLQHYLRFFHGHWGNYWHMETQPHIDLVSFNESKDSAKVFFRLGYQGGEIVLNKVNDKWNVLSYRMTWIE